MNDDDGAKLFLITNVLDYMAKRFVMKAIKNKFS